MEQPKDRSREIEDYDVVSMDDNNNRGNDQDGLPFHPSVAASRADTINVKKMDLGPPEIPHEEIIRGELLGKGSFGIVYSGICRGQPVAIKEPLKQHLTPVELESFQREVRTMSQIFHPNIVLLLGASKPNPLNKSEKLQICMEYCPTDVEKLLQEDRRLRKKRNQEGSSDTSGLLTMVEKLKIAKDAALGLNWLHGINSIVHGDLKSANLLVDSNRRVKVSDFGFSVVKAPNDPRKEPRPLGTPLYMAPEIMRNEGYNGFRADVYAFGLILWEILTSQRLFSEFDDWKPFKEAILGGHRPALPTDTPHLLGILIQRCWDAVPEKRPSFAEVIFRLDECIIDAAIVDEQARKFWKTHFLVPRQHLSEIVPWDQFKIVLAQDINVKTNVIEPAVNLLALEEENNLHQTEIHVTMNHFDKTVLTFGRFFSATEGPSVLNEIISLSAKDWFHGEIDRSEAEKRLKERPNGTWLLRLKDPRVTTAGHTGSPFVLSHVKGQAPVHRVITHDPCKDRNAYSVIISGKNQSFTNLKQLLDYKSLGLTFPCPREALHPKDGYLQEAADDDDDAPNKT